MAALKVERKKEKFMPAIEIEVTDETTHGAYRADVDGTDTKAELTWKARGNARIADHTFTPPAARGQGIAAQLVEKMIADAREQGFTIVPQCPYVAALFRKNPDWADVRAETPS
ncbi:GNAT family N-acetyltransferase [Erythrobacter alti]|uniref:GNAT family N-acetyltransferase n=1 Tax=Erythrobacter alti TaxID=1896145 RepID=UPI0030F3C11C